MLYVVIGALLIGVMLGLLGSGGSILTLPVLVYLLGHQEKVAIAESLAIVGGIAALALIPYARSRLVDWRNVLFFGVPGMVGTYLGAWLSNFVPGTFQLLLFAVVMLLAALLMFRSPKLHSKAGEPSAGAGGEGGGNGDGNGDGGDRGAREEPAADDAKPKAVWLIGGEGLVVGIITGLVGVGGGFLVVPALVLLGKLPMRVAIGTSLAVIALKSFSGFFKYLAVLDGLDLSVNWMTVVAFVAIGVAGSVSGHLIASHINQRLLRKGFAAFLVLMGLFVLAKEAPKLLVATPPAAVVAGAGESAAGELPVFVPPASVATPSDHKRQR